MLTFAVAVPSCGGSVTSAGSEDVSDDDPVVESDGGLSGSGGSSGGAGGSVPRGGAGPIQYSDGGASAGGAIGFGGYLATGGVTNPPPPYQPCPAEMPTHGSPCWVSPAAQCPYDYCYGAVSAICVGWIWNMPIGTCNPPVYEPCPLEAPAEGSPCHASPTAVCQYARYGDCDMTCVGEHWTLGSCNPPPVDAGPQDAAPVPPG